MKSHIKMDDLGGFPITHIATNLHLGSSIPGATMILANLVAALAIGDGIRWWDSRMLDVKLYGLRLGLAWWRKSWTTETEPGLSLWRNLRTLDLFKKKKNACPTGCRNWCYGKTEHGRSKVCSKMRKSLILRVHSSDFHRKVVRFHPSGATLYQKPSAERWRWSYRRHQQELPNFWCCPQLFMSRSVAGTVAWRDGGTAVGGRPKIQGFGSNTNGQCETWWTVNAVYVVPKTRLLEEGNEKKRVIT